MKRPTSMSVHHLNSNFPKVAWYGHMGVIYPRPSRWTHANQCIFLFNNFLQKKPQAIFSIFTEFSPTFIECYAPCSSPKGPGFVQCLFDASGLIFPKLIL
jgi:hypothetical protein